MPIREPRLNKPRVDIPVATPCSYDWLKGQCQTETKHAEIKGSLYDENFGLTYADECNLSTKDCMNCEVIKMNVEKRD